MKTSKRPIIILILTLIFIFCILPVVSFFVYFRYTWIPIPIQNREAAADAEKNAEEAWDEAVSYLEDQFDDLDEDDIIEAMWFSYPNTDRGIPYLFPLITKNKGQIFCYTVYAEEDDLEFEVVVDTRKITETYDTYETNLQRRDIVMDYMKNYEDLADLYERVFLNGNSGNFYEIYEDDTQNNFDLMTEDLYMSLSRINKERPFFLSNGNRSFNSFYIELSIDQDAMDFCKENFDFLIDLNEETIKTKETLSTLTDLERYPSDVFVDLILMDNSRIHIGTKDGPYVSDDSRDVNDVITEYLKIDSEPSSHS